MKSWDELSSDPRSEAWFNDWINVPAPSGESLQDQYTRVSHFLNEIRESDLQKVCIFAHGGVLTCARVYAGEYDLKEAFKMSLHTERSSGWNWIKQHASVSPKH